MVVGHIEFASLKTFINQLELNILKFKLSYIPNKMVVLGKIVLHFLDVLSCPIKGIDKYQPLKVRLFGPRAKNDFNTFK